MFRFHRWLFAPVLVLAALTGALPSGAGNISLPPNTAVILDHIYAGKREAALSEIHDMQQKYPTHPLPYLLEAEAEWWRIWCSSAEYKYGMTMARHRDRLPSDQHYLGLAQKAYKLAEASLRQQESGEMHLYAGMADALEARLYGLRFDTRATAHAGVRGREHFLNALARDPSLADAYTGLGLYNYYVDTLSTIARVIRFFMGVPGGSKEEGIKQLNRAIREGQLTPPVARFYLALNLENYDQRYEDALQAISPLVEKYSRNPIYLLVQGDLYAKLERRAQAETAYRAALTASDQVEEPPCRAKMKQLAQESLAALRTK